MDTKKTIRKILFISMWLVIGGGMLTLLIAAMGKKNKEYCSDYAISINTKQKIFFVDEKDVLKLLMDATKGNIKGQPMSAFNLRRLEELLWRPVRCDHGRSRRGRSCLTSCVRGGRPPLPAHDE